SATGRGGSGRAGRQARGHRPAASWPLAAPRGVADARTPDMISIAERPPEADERRVPGHWEGDLLIGKRNQTAIGTLVERSSGFTMLMALPDGYKPEHVAPALARKVQTLPDALRRSLTWDQGPEMRDWQQVRIN